jgi:hypothetical protein
MTERGTFARWQRIYAEYNIPTFPLKDNDKTPAVKHWQRIGINGSAELAAKFQQADVFGFNCGPGIKVTVLDCDSTDENVLADALARHGKTPAIVRTASGKFHAYYGHNGEKRLTKQHFFPDVPIDLLGNGVAVAMPSKHKTGVYEFIEGDLVDFGRLPVMRGLEGRFYKPLDHHKILPLPSGETIIEGRRNDELFRHCMRKAHICDNLDQLLADAREFNETFLPPLSEGEVMETASSAWAYTEKGLNRFGQHGAWLPTADIAYFAKSRLHVEYMVLGFLLAHNGPEAVFMVANGLAETLGFDRKRFAKARSALIDLGYIEQVRQACRDHPALFRWRNRRADG